MSLQSDFEERFDFAPFTPLNQGRFDGVSAQLPCIYGVLYENGNSCQREALLNLAAHLYFIDSGSSHSPKKDVASRSVGGVSLSYVQGATDNNFSFFNSTKYGQRYLMLIDSGSGAVFV